VTLAPQLGGLEGIDLGRRRRTRVSAPEERYDGLGPFEHAAGRAAVVLNPEAVIIGGGVSRAGSCLLEPLTSRIPELVPVAPRVLLSALGEDALALAALRLAVQAVEERLFDVAATEAV
jgi:hypothetical protein